MSLTRRVFLHWSAIASAALTVARRTAQSQAKSTARGADIPGLEAKVLLPLAQVVLPAELGAARIERATIAFSTWIAGYREGEELLHPYGSERIGKTGPSPAPKWIAQLHDLSTAAESKYKKPFGALQEIQRADVLRDALAGVQFNARVPAPIAAPHVAVALVAHFLESTEAKNLAYEKVIDAKTCRPLATSPNEPVALQRAGGRRGRG